MPRASSRALALGIALVALPIAASSAQAASTRPEYVAQSDPICRAGFAQERAEFNAFAKSSTRYSKHHPNEEPNKPSKQFVRLVVGHFRRFLAIERRVTDQLRSVTPAPGDEAAVAEWLQLRGRSADVLDRAIDAERRRKVKRMIGLYLKSIRRSLQAVVPISEYGFRYCSLPEPV